MKNLGLIVNPIAGMGGSVGLKGTDGVIEEAMRLGATPGASAKAARALKKILPLKHEATVLCCTGAMGASALNGLDLNFKSLYNSAAFPCSSKDTREAAKTFLAVGVDIIAFAGGDGTARDIYEAIGEAIPVLGIPAGVKIHSPVYAKTPESAGELLFLYLSGQTAHLQEAEVLDINEEDYRLGTINTRLFGYLKIPFERRFMQGGKAPSPLSEKSQQLSIASFIAEDMAPDVYYLVGPGSTTRSLMEYLKIESTLLGVDVICGGRTIAKDVSERDILAYMEDKPVKLIITPTGGQGCLLGRGNQQISPKVIKKLGKNNIIVAATNSKLSGLSGQPLIVDTGDPETDELLRGYVRVVTGYRETVIFPVE